MVATPARWFAGLTPFAQKVLAAARALDSAEGAVRKAEQRRVERSAEMRDAVRDLILAMSTRAG